MAQSMAPLPPGPRIAVVETLLFVLGTRAYLERCAARYGDPFTIPLLDGPKVVTGDPDFVRAIFTADPDVFDAPPPEAAGPLFGPRSVLLVDGAIHRRKRKLLMPPFHGARMRAYDELMVDTTERHLAKLRSGGRFDAGTLTQRVSMEIIIRAIFGAHEEDRVERLRAAIVDMMARFTPALFYFPFLRRTLGGHGPWSRYLRARERLERLLQDEIDARRGESGREDILSLLLGCRDEDGQPMSDDELRDELRTMLIAGQETSAITMSWALYELQRAPAAARRLEEELSALGPSPDPERLAKLPYLTAVCDETFRVHPVVPVVIRRLNRPHAFIGAQYPAGTTFAPSVMLAHFNPGRFPEPDAFRPQRFLDRTYTPFEYFPFGGGARRCLGASFAVHEMKIVLGTIVANHRFSLARSEPITPRIAGITMGPSRPIELVYEGRRA